MTTTPAAGVQAMGGRAGRWLTFAALVLILSGAFDVIWGITALAHREVFRPARANVIDVGYAASGWVAIVVGGAVLATGLFVYAGRFWACQLAIWLAVFSAIANLLEIGAYPVWSTLVIGLDVLVIWAISVHGPDMFPDSPPPRGIVRTAGDAL